MAEQVAEGLEGSVSPTFGRVKFIADYVRKDRTTGGGKPQRWPSTFTALPSSYGEITESHKPIGLLKGLNRGSVVDELRSLQSRHKRPSADKGPVSCSQQMGHLLISKGLPCLRELGKDRRSPRGSHVVWGEDEQGSLPLGVYQP